MNCTGREAAPTIHSKCVATHASTCSRVCGNNLNIVSMCVVSPVVHTSNMFVITENIMKRPVFY